MRKNGINDEVRPSSSTNLSVDSTSRSNPLVNPPQTYRSEIDSPNENRLGK
jgi:hypothetical protein